MQMVCEVENGTAAATRVGRREGREAEGSSGLGRGRAGMGGLGREVSVRLADVQPKIDFAS